MSLWTPPPDDAPRRLADLRVTYDLGTLAPEDLPGAPLAAFHGWFAEAEAAGLPEPNAMVVSTATTAGAPSSRTVLLKDADARGFVFYTNLTSRKGRELAENPQASLVFPWFAIHRQVTVVGSAELIGRDEVETYFRSRPRGSQLGAWASEQSTVIDGRDALEARYAELTEQYGEEGEIPVPGFWGGWLIRPSAIEFWQGRPSRLHDRLRFRATVPQADLSDVEGWVLERLSP
jgi:pyridoxamine 5'-phosphate oxidase